MSKNKELENILSHYATQEDGQRRVESELVGCLQALQYAVNTAESQQCWKDARWEDIEKNIAEFMYDHNDDLQSILQSVDNESAPKKKLDNVISFQKKVNNKGFPKQARAVRLFMNLAIICSKLYLDQLEDVRFNLVGDHQAELRRTYFQALLSFPENRPAYVLRLIKRIYELLVARGLGTLKAGQLQQARCHVNQQIEQVDQEFAGKLSAEHKDQKNEVMNILDELLESKERKELAPSSSPNVAPRPAGV